MVRIKGKIYSINISKRKGISKFPVSEAELIKGLGVKGDAHSSPGDRQVSLLSIESIRRQFACPKIKNVVRLKPGDFAENITTEGIDLASLKIGDVLMAGKVVELQISKIGKECHKFCSIYHKAGDCIMPREGIFTRVLKGGKIKVRDKIHVIIKTAILTISDRASKGEYPDKSGEIIKSIIKDIQAEIVRYEIIPDDPKLIKQKFIEYCDSLKMDLVISTGGTGLGPRDFTPEVTAAIIEKEVPGISEAIRIEGLKSTRRAMLSRGITGIRGQTLIINLPGSPKAVREALATILEAVQHGLEMMRGKGH